MGMSAGGRIAADRALRAGAYHCAECGGPLVLKRGAIVVAHFAHARAASECAWAHGETIEHLSAKAAIAAAFAARGIDASMEVPVLSTEGDRRADVLIHDPRGGAVAIEVQHSALDEEAIARRTRAYAAAGLGVVWVATLGPALLAAARAVAPRRRVLGRYAAPAWQQYAAAYNGALWFWCDGALWRGWFEDVWLAREDADAPGADPWQRSRRWRELTLEGPFEPDALRIARRGHRLALHERFAWPGDYAAAFVIGAERAVPASASAIPPGMSPASAAVSIAARPHPGRARGHARASHHAAARPIMAPSRPASMELPRRARVSAVALG